MYVKETLLQFFVNAEYTDVTIPKVRAHDTISDGVTHLDAFLFGF